MITIIVLELENTQVPLPLPKIVYNYGVYTYTEKLNNYGGTMTRPTQNINYKFSQVIIHQDPEFK